MTHKTNWTKKVTILLAAICVALAGFSAFAPPSETDWLLKVEGVPISREIYSYFLSEALLDAERDKQGQPKDMSALRKDVKARCVEFVAINSELNAMEIPIEQQLKSQVAERTASFWRVFGKYYTSIGVDKPTLNKILTNEAAKDQLFRALYDADGTNPTPEAELEDYFYENFVAYEGMRVFLTVMQDDGTERDMTTAEIASLRQTLSSLVKTANDNNSFYEITQDARFAEAISYGTPSITVVQKGAGGLRAEDFEKISNLSRDKVTMLELPGFFLLATGVEMEDSPDEYYNGYRSDCLKELKTKEFEAALAGLCKQMHADENVAPVSRLLKEWDWTR